MKNFSLKAIEKPRIMEKAAQRLNSELLTVTAHLCDRSQGGPHDFYSEGDYWWPNPEDPNGPYIRRDGESNPNNFNAHRQAMLRLSDIVGSLTCAYRISGDEKYAAQAITHLKAWFVDQETRMNPSLLYGQAIQGLHSGRSIGVIDTIHLVEGAHSAKLLCKTSAFTHKDQTMVKAWFCQYLTWLNTHAFGKTEKQHPNNHGICWSLQAAAFAYLVGDKQQLTWIRNQFKRNYLAEMMAENGSFPAELARTKPYGYSLFVIDALAGVAQIASTPENDLWAFQLPDGRSMQRGMKFIVPYIKDKGSWPMKPDVMYWDEWPARHASLLFAGKRLKNADYLKLWGTLDAEPKSFEGRRNLPLRYPLLWVSDMVF